ncbi:MAG TPA: hypothetical protein VLF19_08095 [Methylomirabilota bacterium]|nr:hypothetical protein [Methylomirabilota bacterium]
MPVSVGTGLRVTEPARVRKTERTDVCPAGGGAADRARQWVARAFTRLEDVVYVGLSVLLAGTALGLLATGLIDFVRLLITGTLSSWPCSTACS